MSDSNPSTPLRHRKIALHHTLLIAGTVYVSRAVFLSIKLPGSGTARLIAITTSVVNVAFFLSVAWYNHYGQRYAWFAKLPFIVRAAFVVLPTAAMVVGVVTAQRTSSKVISDVLFLLILLVSAVVSLVVKRQTGK